MIRSILASLFFTTVPGGSRSKARLQRNMEKRMVRHFSEVIIELLTFSSCTPFWSPAVTTARVYLVFVENGTVVRVGSMSLQRTLHVAVSLSNGSVLVIGGAVEVEDGKPLTPTASVERFDWETLQFTTVGRILTARYGHEAVTDDDGEIFIFGGFGCGGMILFTIEYLIYEFSQSL
jgi:hypothetical protein